MAKITKILWFSNYRFSNESIRGTGSWLKVMGETLSAINDLEFYNITSGQTKIIAYEKSNNINQYIIPFNKKRDNSLPSKRIVSGIVQIIKDINPDIIHIWGTENYWGLITADLKYEGAVLLEIQGLTTQITTQFYGGLSLIELLKSTGIKELLKIRSHLLIQKNQFSKKSAKEIDIIRKHQYISVQSEWSKNTVLQLNKEAIIFESLRPLRKEFITNAGMWMQTTNNIVFFSASSMHSFKGLHVLIRALGLLKRNHIKVTLKIAGLHSTGIRQSGYELYIKRLIKKMGLEQHVYWLGPINADEIVSELISASVCVIPSYIESYCLALYEAVCIGIPVVCSYAGALPEVTNVTNNVHFFQPGDYYMCAKLISDTFLGIGNSLSDKESLFVSPEIAVGRQLEIYNKLLL